MKDEDIEHALLKALPDVPDGKLRARVLARVADALTETATPPRRWHWHGCRIDVAVAAALVLAVFGNVGTNRLDDATKIGLLGMIQAVPPELHDGHDFSERLAKTQGTERVSQNVAAVRQSPSPDNERTVLEYYQRLVRLAQANRLDNNVEKSSQTDLDHPGVSGNRRFHHQCNFGLA